MNGFSGITAVLFDLDDTFYDYPPANDAGNVSAWAYLAEHTGRSAGEAQAAFLRGREETHAAFRGTAEMHSRLRYIERALAYLGYGGDDALAREAHDLFWMRFIAAVRPRPGARECLAALRESGKKIGIVTDLATDIQRRKLAALHIPELVDVLATSEEAGREKPDPAPFLLALSRLGAAPGDALMVGEDYAKDVEGAGASGIAAIYFRNGRNPDPPSGVVEVRSFQELQTLLLGA